MALTQTQIEELFRFCEKKFVRHYDLQVELVDHLASRIEEEIEVDEKLTFEAALKKVYAGFGLFGFAHIVRERGESLRKQHNKTYRDEVKRFFTLPKIVLTISLFLLFLYAGEMMPSEYRLFVFYALLAPCFFMQLYKLRRLRKMEAKALMLTQYLPASGFFPVVFIFDGIIFDDYKIHAVLFAALCILLLVFESAFFEVTNRITGKAKRLYPEAFKTT